MEAIQNWWRAVSTLSFRPLPGLRAFCYAVGMEGCIHARTFFDRELNLQALAGLAGPALPAA
jgi:hypothetical protein